MSEFQFKGIFKALKKNKVVDTTSDIATSSSKVKPPSDIPSLFDAILSKSRRPTNFGSVFNPTSSSENKPPSIHSTGSKASGHSREDNEAFLAAKDIKRSCEFAIKEVSSLTKAGRTVKSQLEQLKTLMGDFVNENQRLFFLPNVNGEYSYLVYSLIHRRLLRSLSTMDLLIKCEGQELNNISKSFEDDVLGALTRGKNYPTVSTTLTDVFNRIKELVDEVPNGRVDENSRLQIKLRIFDSIAAAQVRKREEEREKEGKEEGEEEEEVIMLRRRPNDLHGPPTPLFDSPLDKEDKKEERAYVLVTVQGGIVNAATTSAPPKPTASHTPLQTTKEEPAIEPREANLTTFDPPAASVPDGVEARIIHPTVESASQGS
jgi:gas vesicle protein